MHKLTAGVLSLLMFASCGQVKNIAYFQDKALDHPEEIDKHGGIVIQPKDMISIVVSSRNPELSTMFNLPVVNYQAGSETVSTGGQQRLLGYVVDNDGYIDFPVLGTMKVAGMTRWELSEYIKDTLLKKGYLNDAVVTVEFMNFKVSVLGEVNNPGTYTIEGDKVTILEALSMAKDLTIYGQRDQVYVIREENGNRTIYKMDLRSTDLFDSPAYFLKQNDIIYVQPNKVKAGQSTVNENNLKSVGLWISIASLLASVGTLVVSIIRD